MDDLARTLELVRDPDPQIRKYALGQLEAMNDALDSEEALEALRQATADGDPLVSHQANRSLVVLLHRSFGPPLTREGQVGSGAGGEALFEGVPYSQLRAAGLQRLGAVLEALHELARGKDLVLAKRAIISLAKLGAPGSVAVLSETLFKPGLGEVSAVALPELGTPGAARPILDAVARVEGPLRAHAVLALGKLGTPEAREMLFSLVKDKNVLVRTNAAMAMADLADLSDALLAIDRLVRDQESWVVIYGLRALARVPGDRAYELLAASCRDAPDDRVRASGVAALGERRDARAEPLLAEFLRAADDRVRANAVEAVALLGVPGPRLKALLTPLAVDPSNRVRGNVAVALHPVDPTFALKVVKSLLTATDEWSLASGIWCLGQLKTVETLDWLVRVLDAREDEEALTRAVRALERRAGEAAPPALLRHLAHPHVPTRARVARALGRMAGEGLLDVLVARYREEQEPTVRSALVFALGDVRDATAATAVAAALQDPEPRVVADAVEVLGGLFDLQVAGLLKPFAGHANNRVRANALVGLWKAGELAAAEDLGAQLLGRDPAGLRSGLYAAGEVGRVLRLLDGPRANPVLLAALKRARELATRTDDLPEATPGEPADGARGADELEAVVETYLRKGPAAALAQLKALPESHPCAMEVAFLSYRLQVEAGRPSEAFRTLETVETMGGAFVPPLLDLANGYSHLRMEGKALNAFLEAYRRYQAVLAELGEIGAGAVAAGKLADASQLCRFLMGGAVFGPDVHLSVGRELLAASEFQRALPHLLRAHLVNPRNAALCLDYGYAACRVGRTELGLRLCEEVLLVSPDQGAAVVKKARKLLALINAKAPAGGDVS